MDLWAVLVPILVADVVNPVLLAGVIYELGSSRPVANSSALLLGHTTAYFFAGVALGIGIEAITERLANPEPIDFVIEGVLGVALLAVGVAMARGKQAEQEFEEDDGHGPLNSFALGAIVNLIGIPFAIPYFGAIAQILKADLAWNPSLTVLLVYNLIYALPFALVIVARVVFRKRADEPLRRLNQGMERVSGVLAPLLLILLGAAFLLDAGWYFVRGVPLYEL
ncbi:MAG: GAP family protein [Myxococcota bacterium]|nr:GAP family protein [Myxococcota bacterium]